MNKIKVTLLFFFFLFNCNVFCQVTLSHNVGNTVIPNTMYSCSGGGICWARKFVLADFGITANQSFTINTGEVGLFYSINWDTNLQFNIYAVDDNFPTSFSESTLIGSSQVVPVYNGNNTPQIITIAFTNPVVVPAGTGTILVEVFQLYSNNSEAHAFVAATAMDNDDSWFRSKAAGCNPYTYVTSTSLGHPEAKFYITVNGQPTNIGPFNVTVLSNCDEFSKEFNLSNATDIGTVSWDFNDISSGVNNTSTSINPTHVFSAIGQYHVTAIVTHLSGQIYTVNQLINVVPPPIAIAVQPINACEDPNNSGVASFNTSNIEAILLGSQTGMTVSYFDSNGNPLQSPLPNPLITATTIITARVARNNNLNCYNQTNISLIVNPKPIVHTISTIYACDGDTDGIATFDLSNVTSTLLGTQTGMVVDFYNGNNQILPNPLPNFYSNSIVNQETLTAKVTNPLTNCWTETTFNLVVNTVQPPVIVTPQLFCIQQNATLNDIAINGQIIKWYDSPVNGNLLTNSNSLVNLTTYYATQTSSNCESSRAPITINIQNTAAPSGNTNQIFCATQSPILNDLVLNGNSIIWYSSFSATTPLTNSTILTDGTTYYATQTLNNCESVNRLPIMVTLINTLNANDYSEVICGDLINGSEIVNLPNYNTNLISNISNCTFEYYTSLLGATNQTNTELISSATNYILTTGLHIVYVRITSTNGCYQIVKLNLTLVNKPILRIPDSVPLCERSNITIDAGFGFDSYTWSTGSTSQVISISQAGIYSVTVTQNHGNVVCSSTKNFTVILSNTATITSIETHDWTDNDNTIVVNATGLGDYEYSIDGINYQTSNTFSGLSSGAYVVYIRDKNGCGITTQDIFLLMYPKFFTPNGDGYNDNWSVKFSQYEQGLKIAIYDRYGKLLNLLDNQRTWDGTYNGQMVVSDDYWFVVTRSNGREYRGHFTLKR